MDNFNTRAARARQVDLAQFLISHHPDQVKVTGHSVYLKDYDSVYTKQGFCGYTRFSTSETGNAVDLLVRYLGYTPEAAVDILAREGVPVTSAFAIPGADKGLQLPVPANPPYKRVYAYLLNQRGIPESMIRHLFREKLLYQEADTGNAVFLSRDRKFCELRGTNTYAQPFHGIRRSRPDAFWSLRMTSEKVEVAFLCEGAIDAVSLAVLHQKEGYKRPAAYISIGGVCNQQTIERIAASPVHTVLAMDNDMAGRECCIRNPDLERMLPQYKDWNEELLKDVRKQAAARSI